MSSIQKKKIKNITWTGPNAVIEELYEENIPSFWRSPRVKGANNCIN